MPLPFISLAPQIPRVVDIHYEANLGFCDSCTDCSDTSETDVTDLTDIEII